VLSIFGGKITTFRKLAEHCARRAEGHISAMKPSWTETAQTPRRRHAGCGFRAFLRRTENRRPFLPEAQARRMGGLTAPGSTSCSAHAKSMADLGEDFGGGLTAAEVDYLVRREWARSAADILWRRSKLGLHVPPGAEAGSTPICRPRGTAAIAAQ
jgi:glycerol-3-phosphate dehydrogenase